jgi:hypothetical protein
VSEYLSAYEEWEATGNIAIKVSHTREQTIIVDVVGAFGTYSKEMTTEDASALAGKIDTAVLIARGHRPSRKVGLRENDMTNVVNFASGSAA